VSARQTALISVLSIVACAGCGPNPKLLAAADTVAVTTTAVQEAEHVINTAEAERPGPPVDHAKLSWDRAYLRLEEAEGIVDTWRESGHGNIAWMTLAPCLAAALVGLQMTLEAAELELPSDLHQAEVMAAEPSGNECASEPRPETSGGDSTGNENENGNGNRNEDGDGIARPTANGAS